MEPPAGTPFPRVAAGTLLLYRLFDVAEGIDLARAEGLLAGEADRLRLTGERSGFLDLPDRPLTVCLGPREIAPEEGAPLAGNAFVRLFALGVASVRYEVPLPPAAGPGELAAMVRAVSGSVRVTEESREEADALLARLAPALVEPHETDLHETYAILLVRSLEPGGFATALGGEPLARLLLGEPPAVPLSPDRVADVTRHRLSYTADDLCVIDWDTALVVEPTGDRSVADVLELASAQLLELRWFDALFETELLEVAGLLGRPRASLAWLFVGRYGQVTRRIQRMVVDSVEFFGGVENALRVVGDLYLARVYRAAAERFRLPEWEASVRRRQEAAARVADLLRSEADSTLGHVLEATIVLLILLEIGLAFLR